ncbi:hypothetical protein [Streptomyces melanogenes]|uniref:hypothetical protein n=1 Tax=Streptomyces melanogenes TaxID=67326 RepID=UPI00167C630B|nr:hypothetical protein [Streptomyces melanogenes]GGP40454.1 hypothetical protein GCM10010278_16490 [Streptomyces melanogenes]
MRDAIARALLWVLRLLLPARGRHAADPAPTPEPARVDPWAKPWCSPSKEEAQALFQRQAEDTLELRIKRERRRALYYATQGIDLPYSYPGAPFPASAFRTTAGVSA